MSESFLPSAPKMKGSRVLDIRDEHNPQSVYNLVHKNFRRAIDNININVWEMTRVELENRCNPSSVVNQLRLSFWDKYNERIEEGSSELITINEVIGRITTYEHGRDIFEDQYLMAYILCPVTDYNAMVTESLEAGLAKLRDCIGKIEVFGSKNKFDNQQANFLFKIVDFLDKRVNGLAVQKIESKSLHLSGDVTKNNNLTPAQIAEKIKNLETDLKEQHNVVEVKND
jgi:hypothetical protein